MYNFSLKLIVQIFLIIIFFSTLQARNQDRFDKGNYISDYFSGILLLNDNQYNASYKFFKKLNGLEDRHVNYSSKYLSSLINSGKFNEAFNYSRKLEKKNLNSFESDLIIGVYFLKNKKYSLASKYFLKTKKKNNGFLINNFVSNSLTNWISFRKIDFDIAKKKN